jgi:hypothetical protein
VEDLTYSSSLHNVVLEAAEDELEIAESLPDENTEKTCWTKTMHQGLKLSVHAV